MTSGLELRGVSVMRTIAGEAERAIVDDVTATFAAGQITLIKGAMGAGKSTLIALLAGIIRPTSGVVLADGEPLSRWTSSHRDRWRQQVGLSLQTPNLLTRMTALENVIVPCVVGGHDSGRQRLAELRQDALEALERLDATALAARPVESLSGGERQRVAVARALIRRPRYLLLDEPTAHQDEGGVSLVADVIEAARLSSATVVVATHDPRLVGAGDSETLLLEGGRLALDAGQEVD